MSSFIYDGISDDVISNDVNQALEENKYPWIKPIVQLIENSQNPFLAADFFSFYSYKSFLNDPTARFYLSSGYEMKVTFDESDYSKLFSSQFSDIAFSALTADRMRTLCKTHRIFITFKINSIESPYPFLEPMLCTAFLYNKTTKNIISDLWNFVPEKCQQFFKGSQFSFSNTNIASFMINPSIITKKNGVLILLFSHPTTVDNGINTVVKYYQNPVAISAMSAAKAVNAAFLVNPNAFSTFCWSYTNLSTDSMNNIEFPSPFLIDHSVFEGEIAELISEAQNKHLKQVPFSISVSIESNINQLILRPVSSSKIMPYLSPIHQLSVHLHQLKMTCLSSARNIMIRISLESTESSSPLCVIHSKFNSNRLTEYEYSRVCYHEKSPKFDDYFLIDLPYPISPTASLVFQIYHVHVKTNDTKSMTEIGKAVLPLFQSSNTNKDNTKDKRKNKDKQKLEDSENTDKNETNDKQDIDDKDKDKRLSKRQSRSEKNKKNSAKAPDPDQNLEKDELAFVPNDIHTISVTSDKTSKLIISTYLRSSLISNDRKYNKFTEYALDFNSSALDSELIKSISSVTLAKNLMIVLDRIIKIYEKMQFFSFDPILTLYNSVSQHLKPHRLNRYLLLYVFYFAFRDTSKINLLEFNESQINLTENGAGSLIDLDQVEFNLKDQHQQANSDTLIDFENDLLFKNDSSSNLKSRRPSLIAQSLYKESDDVLIHTKMIRGIIIFLKEKETEAINQLYPLASFINGLLIKSLVVSKDRILTEEFIEYVDLYTKYASKSEYINDIATKYGKFVDLLFDIGFPTAAAVANSSFIRNCPLRAILAYVSIAYRPEYFLYSVRFIKSFVDNLCQLVNLSFSGDNCSVMQPFFLTINHLCSIYDDTLKVEVASKLLISLTEIFPSKIPPGVQISEGVKFICFLLTYCNEGSMQIIFAQKKLPILMSLIHYLLNRSTSIPITTKKTRTRLVDLANSEGSITIMSSKSSSSTTATTKSSSIATQNSTTTNININNNLNASNNNYNAFNSNNFIMSDSQPSISNVALVKACSSFDSTKTQNLTLESSGTPIKLKNYFDTTKVKKLRNNSNTFAYGSTKGIKLKDEILFNSSENGTSSSNNSININDSNNNIESSIIANDNINCFDVELCTMTQDALFRFIGVFFVVSDLNGGAHLFRFAYHTLQILNLPKPLILKSYYLLHQIILKFSPGIIEIVNPCMTKVVHTLFKKALISQHYHKYIASIISTMFNCDLAAYKNNNRSFVICTQALSMIHYSQLTLDRFYKFMKLLRDSSTQNNNNNNNNNNSNSKKLSKKNKNSNSSSNVDIDGLKEFFELFQKLRSISVDLENPKLTPSQKATHLIRRFYTFKYSPDAQFIALEDLKNHQMKNYNNLEAMNITILQAALIYEYMVKLKRMPNYYDSKFGGKHKYHLISSTSSFEGFLAAKSASSTLTPRTKRNSSIYLIGSTSLCPSEIMSDFPMIPSFCDSDVFSESGFVSLLFKCLNEAENIHRSIISNIILDFIWPIYDSRSLYGHMASVFEAYEKMFRQRVNNARSHSRPKIGQITTQNQPNERDPFDGQIVIERENLVRNSRTTKNRKSSRNKKYAELNDFDSNPFYIDESNEDTLDNATAGNFEDSDNHNTFFRVLFCGKIFESDNGQAFIYRAEPGISSAEFRKKLGRYYESLMGRGKVVVIDDQEEEEEQNQEQKDETSKNTNKNETKETTTINKNEANNNNETSKTNSTENNNNNESNQNENTEAGANENAEPNANENSNNNTENENKNKEKEESESKEESNESENTSTETTSNNNNNNNNNNIINNDTKVDSPIWKMDDNIGYIKVDKVIEVNNDERSPSYQHQIFYVDEYNYSGKYKFSDNLFFNSSHNSTNSSNFSNIYSFFNTYNNFNSYSNSTSFLNYDSYDQLSSKSTTNTNYNYSYFNIYNYINNYMKSKINKKEEHDVVDDELNDVDENSIENKFDIDSDNYSNNYSNNIVFSDAQKKSLKKLAKRTMRRNYVAVRSQIPSLLQRSEIIKVEASDFSPIMCAYQHLADFTIKMKKNVEMKQMRDVQALLVSELTENKKDNFVMIIIVFVEKLYEWKKKKNHSNNNSSIDDDEEEEEEEEESEQQRDKWIDDTFKEPEQIIRKNRKEFDKIVPNKLIGILKLFLNVIEKAIRLHGKWVINNLEYVPLQFQFEHQFRRYNSKLIKVLKQ